MSISLLLFLIGTLGFVLNRKNIILMLISIEIMLLAITFLILVSSLSFDDILGQTYAIYIIAIAGAESAIGLGILVAFYRLRERSLPTPTYSLLPLKNNYIKKVSSKLSISPTLIRYYSTESGKFILHPLFVSGFADAESSFVVTILRKAGYNTGWAVQARFQIKLHETDRPLLLLIQKFFGNIGAVSTKNTRSTVEFRVSTLSHLINVIIPHFEKYSLITNKHSDFFIFKQIVLLMSENQHRNLEGLQLILNNRASLNWGLTETLKLAFPLTLPVLRVQVENKLENLLPEWLAGFCSGECNFFITISRSYAWLRFSISQDVRDILLLENIVNFFNCGYVSKYKNRKVCEFVVTKIDDIILYIIPFFEKYPIRGSKHENYIYFKEAA